MDEVHYGGKGPHWAVVPMKKKENVKKFENTLNIKEEELHFFSSYQLSGYMLETSAFNHLTL